LKDVRDPGAKPDQWRYVSFAHLKNDPSAAARLDGYRAALFRAVNMLHKFGMIYQPKAIDDERTVYRLELDKLGWDVRPFPKLNGKPAVDPSRISLYDLVLLEYPHGAVPDESETGKAVVKDYLARAGMLRPIAYVRGDWFVDAVTRTPLYDDLLQ